jgi:hypothetical protein
MKPTFVLSMPQWIFAISTIIAFAEYLLLVLCDALRFLCAGAKNVAAESVA